MSTRIREHVRSNVVGYVALFFALGGGAAWATHPNGTNTISTGDIQNNQVFSADVRDDNLAGGGLTGIDINEATLKLAAGAWREVGAAGQPSFNSTPTCEWKNFGGGQSTAAFIRDRFGFVHLKGLVHADDVGGPGNCFVGGNDPRIFTLPAGYRPAKQSVFATITNSELGRFNVDGPNASGLGAGAVFVEDPTTNVSAKAWISLNGFSFRCAPSGSNGCP